MGVLFAIASAALYGTGDFFGGMAAKRLSIWVVVPVSGLFGLLTACAATAVLSPGVPLRSDLELGALAGIVGGGAIACLYRGLAIARMSVVAPITAVVAAVVPVVYGIAIGERPALGAFIGIVLALVAVALVSASAQEDVSGKPEPASAGLALALAAGLGFGLLYVILARTSHAMWPLVAARTTSTLAVGTLAIVTRRFGSPRPALGSTAMSGVFDMFGNVLYLLALRHTLVAIAAVVTSLYPASTVLLARLVLRERLTSVQWMGVACAGAGIVLIGVSS